MVQKLTFTLIFLTWILPALYGQSTNEQIDPGTQNITRIENFDITVTDREQKGYNLAFRALYENGEMDFNILGPHRFIINKDTVSVYFVSGRAVHPVDDFPEKVFATYLPEEENKDLQTDQLLKTEKLFFFKPAGKDIKKNHVPLWLSVIPPLLTIVMALALREVIISLVAGIWLGSFIIYGFRIEDFFNSLFAVVDQFVINAITDPDHAAVILFSLLIGGMVAIISRNGGMAGIVQKLSKYANSSRNAGLITWVLGIAIFFDDYANTLIVGNTMKPVTDRFRISREKLAYLVDSTAAPVAAIALITTWIGAELLYISEAVTELGISESAYSVFLHSLQFAFYPIFTLIFIFFLVMLNRDYGSMYKAEMRARETGELYAKRTEMGSGPVDDSLQSLEPRQGIKYKVSNALLPILTVLLVTMIGLAVTGYNAAEWQQGNGLFNQISNVIGNANPYTSLIWGSFMGCTVALLMSVMSKTLNFRYGIETMMDGFKTMLPAVIILILAWSLAEITKELHTANFLTHIISGNIAPVYLPLITFVIAGLISFSTGSSWGTMAILYPLILPTTYLLGISTGMGHDEVMFIFYNVTAMVLGGSVLGDHCSPISDTTILSSLASSCNHVDHVRTQLPYALTVGAITILIGGVLFQIGLHWSVNFILGIIMLFLIVRFVGKKVPVTYVDKEDNHHVKTDGEVG
jgi:Na+/H+ antiporter NhaC